MPVTLNLQIKPLTRVTIPARPVGVFGLFRRVYGADSLGFHVLLLALMLFHHGLRRDDGGHRHRQHSWRY